MTEMNLTTTSDGTSSRERLETDDILKMTEDRPERHVAASTQPALSNGRFGESRSSTPSDGALRIVVRPLGQGRFAALLEGRLLCESRTPLLSAARVLQAEGASGTTLLEMVHEGSAIVVFRMAVGAAAGLRVSETGSMPRFVPWQPDQLPATALPSVPLEG